MTPAEEMRAAATKLRETAKGAMPGPWESMDDGDRIIAWRVGPGGFDDDFEYVIDEPTEHGGNADWIALVHPGLAEPLAALLEHFARIEDDFAALGLPPAEVGAPDGRMLAVARVINGGAS